MPQSTVKNHVVSGAKMVTCLGLDRRNFSAYLSITVRPPEVCKKPAQVTTAIIINITSTGGLPGLYWKTKVKMIRPMPLITARPMPPCRTPISKHAKSTTKPKAISMKYLPFLALENCDLRSQKPRQQNFQTFATFVFAV